MFQFPGFAAENICILLSAGRYSLRGLSHSEISGSKPVSGSPELFAAVHVLHRLSLPRHPPCALCSLTLSLRHAFSSYSESECQTPCTTSQRSMHFYRASLLFASIWTLTFFNCHRTVSCFRNSAD